MNIRKITSLIMLLSFLLCIMTSVILYIAPHGRVAYWSEWRFWNLSKTQWGDLHLNLGLLLLCAGLLHVYYNWVPLVTYLKNKTKQLNIFTANFNIALIITLLVGIGTYLQIPPMVSIIDFSLRIKDKASITYGEPPYGHAELSSLKMFTRNTGLDLAGSMKLLQEAAVKVNNESQTIADIAQQNNLAPKDIYEIIKPAAKEPAVGAHAAFPGSPPPGFGNKTLNDICTEYNLNPQQILLFLNQRGIQSYPSSTIKKTAAENSMDPMALFEILSEAAVSN